MQENNDYLKDCRGEDVPTRTKEPQESILTHTQMAATLFIYDMICILHFYLQHIDMLESKVSQITEQLEAQLELQRTAERRVRQYDSQRADVEERLRKMEAELVAGDVLRDGMRVDKERVSGAQVTTLNLSQEW